MARIRTIKPDFFRHEGLQDLERDHPGNYVMLAFAGLWTLCDKAGRFEWKPRTIKLDVLPFLDFDMGTTLTLLERFSYVRRYEVDGKLYGVIPSFEEHQRINGKEAQEPAKHPEPVEFLEPEVEGSNGEATGKQSRSQEGKGREGKRKGREEEGEGNGSLSTAVALDRAPLPVAVVFEFWQQAMRHPNAKLDDKRRKAIKQALDLGYTVDQLKTAVEGCARSPWHMGQNDRGEVYDDISLICRDAQHIDKFIRNATTAPLDNDPVAQFIREGGNVIEGEVIGHA